MEAFGEVTTTDYGNLVESRWIEPLENPAKTENAASSISKLEKLQGNVAWIRARDMIESGSVPVRGTPPGDQFELAFQQQNAVDFKNLAEDWFYPHGRGTTENVARPRAIGVSPANRKMADVVAALDVFREAEQKKFTEELIDLRQIHESALQSIRESYRTEMGLRASIDYWGIQ